jgi:hypothetical protein
LIFILDEKKHSIKISQLVDDTTLFCNSKEDVLKAMNEIEIFDIKEIVDVFHESF